MGLLYMAASGRLLNMFVLLQRGNAPFISSVNNPEAKVKIFIMLCLCV